MFGAKTSGPSLGGLTVNTGSANSLFGNTSTPASSTTTPAPAATSGTTGGIFGNLGGSSAQSKPGGGLFGNLGGGSTQQSSTGTSMFSGQQQSGSTTGGGLFGAAATSQPQSSSGLFSGAAGSTTGTTQSGTTGGGLFGGLGSTSTPQTQNKSLFGGLGGSTTTGGGLFSSTNQNTAQQQQTQRPTSSLFTNQTTQTQQSQQPPGSASVVQGVRIDVENLLPTTKFESCAEQLQKGIEEIDNFILNQMNMCHEVANMLPSIAEQGATVPNDVEFVQGKLDTMQHALENDANDIDHLRNLVTRDAAEAQVAFRSIDTLRLPLQYQPSATAGLWPNRDEKVTGRQTIRLTRKNTLALPDDIESDPATASTINGVPLNLVDYFSQRSDEMDTVLGRYRRNLKEIEDHLHGVEVTLNRQISDFVASRSRDSAAGSGLSAKSTLNDLAAVLGDVESGILGVASRLGATKEQVQELVLGPPSIA